MALLSRGFCPTEDNEPIWTNIRRNQIHLLDMEPHRTGGPAWIGRDGSEGWWINDLDIAAEMETWATDLTTGPWQTWDQDTWLASPSSSFDEDNEFQKWNR